LSAGHAQERATTTIDTCLGCEAPSGGAMLCDRCRPSPFAVEQARKEAAKRGDTDRLARLYTADHPLLRQGEPGRLWDDVLAGKDDPLREFAIWRNGVSASMVPAGAKRVLEIGIGMGHALRYLARHRPDLALYGTDVSEHAIHRAQEEFPSAALAATPIESIPWPDVKFDAILFLEVLEHIEATRTLAILGTIRERLTDDGRLILSVPLETVQDLRNACFVCPHCGVYVHPIGHVRSYSEMQPLLAELAMTGFSVERRQGLAPGRYRGIPRQWLMRLLPRRVHPMVMIVRCRKDRQSEGTVDGAR
jgi:2-polyprenyl-3-methyl-5-hydroxy-6-metoxy-1,4-benzoquinol methylase